MSTKDKIGIAVLVALFALLAVLLYWTIQPPSGPVRRPEESVIIRQRIINIEKSN
jgi:hypothetical protein